MSETITRIDAVTELAAWIRQVGSIYNMDLRAITQDQYSKSAGAACRAVHDFTAEVCGMNHYTAAIVRGETRETTEEVRAEFKASMATIEAATLAVTRSCEDLANSIDANRDTMDQTVKAPWGDEMTKYRLANIAANHIMYHDGQIAFLQCLNGDDKMHWFDE